MKYGVETRILSEDQLKFLQENPEQVFTSDIGITDDPQIPQISLPSGGTLYFASTQPKKFYEIDKVLTYSRSRLKLRDAIDVFHWFHSADETSKTYIGNAYEKAEALLDRVYDDIGYEKFIGRIKERGDNPNHVLFGVNDTGSSFHVDYSDEPEFKQSRHEKGLGAWPGVELGPVMDAQGGVKGFFSSLKRMKRRITKDGKIEPDLRGTDDNLYIIFKLTPKREDIKFVTFFSRVPIQHKVTPSAKNDVLTTYHFSRSLDSNLTAEQREKSRAELGAEYVGVHSSQALGFRRCLMAASIPQSLVIQFADKSREQAQFTIATQHNALPAGKINKKLDDPIIREISFVQQAKHVNSIENRAYQELTNNADAVVLGGHDPMILQNYDRYALDLLDLFCSLIVDKQLRVETFENTPFYILNKKRSLNDIFDDSADIDWNDPQIEKRLIDVIKHTNSTENPWLRYLLFLQYLHEKAFVKQEPQFLFTQFSPDDPKLVKTLKRDLYQARGKDNFVPHYENEEWGTDRTDLFEVTILGSASTRVASYNEDAYDLGQWIVGNGWHLRTGGGRYGIMGAATAGGVSSLESRGEHDPAGHISAIQMPRTVQFEGAAFKQAEAASSETKILRIAPSFDDRMTSLFRSDVCIGMAAGIGTIQEEARWLRLKQAGLELLKGKKMILLNCPQEDGDGLINIKDMFLSLVPQHIIDDHLTIVSSVDEVKEAVVEIYNAQYEERYNQGVGYTSIEDGPNI